MQTTAFSESLIAEEWFFILFLDLNVRFHKHSVEYRKYVFRCAVKCGKAKNEQTFFLLNANVQSDYI